MLIKLYLDDILKMVDIFVRGVGVVGRICVQVLLGGEMVKRIILF